MSIIGTGLLSRHTHYSYRPRIVSIVGIGFACPVAVVAGGEAANPRQQIRSR